MRTPEPEIMDGSEQSAAYANADFTAVNAGFVASFAARFDTFAGGVLIDLGCGPAEICLLLAQTYTTAQVHGVDASEEMLGHGRRAIAQAHLDGRVRLHQRYLPLAGETGLPLADAVVSNSLLHHLAAPETLWQTIARVGRPGAAVYVMDLLRPASIADASEIVDRYAAGEPDVLRHDFFHSLCAAYRVDEIEEQLENSGLRGMAVDVISDRHVCVSGCLPAM